MTDGRLHRRFYWSIPPAEIQSSMNISDAQEQVENALIESVRYRLKSDVEVGCQLSGGIDSSLITLLATRYLNNKKPTAVSVIHDNPKFSEESWIDKVCWQLVIPVEKIQLSEQDFFNNITRATWHRDLPINSANSIPILFMSRLAKKHFTVFLSGEGADELFGGYEHFFGGHFLENPFNYQLLRVMPVANRLLSDRYIVYGDTSFDLRNWYISRSSYISSDQMQAIRPTFTSDRFMDKRRQIFDCCSGSFISRAQYYELKTWLVDLLLRQDTMTMANSVENRVPFLDHNLVELARRLPTNCLEGKDPRVNRSTKIVLKHIATRHFGKRFSYRKKTDLPPPGRLLFQSKDQQLVDGCHSTGHPNLRDI